MRNGILFGDGGGHVLSRLLIGVKRDDLATGRGSLAAKGIVGEEVFEDDVRVASIGENW